MKKLFAILALVILCGTYAFANDSWNDTKNGSLHALFLCLPTINVVQTDGGNLGTYFDDVDADIAAMYSNEATVTWNVKAPENYGMKFTRTGPTPAVGTTATLTGDWKLKNFDWTNVDNPAEDWYPGSVAQGGWGCQNAYPITFKAKHIKANGAQGVQTWIVTVKAEMEV